jgi:flavin-dependent dehydrogenase
LRCGDAAGFIPPFSGDGMAMAARAGELAGVTLGARLTHGDADTIYAAAWRREFESRLRWANALQPFFMEPLLSRSALTLASRVPPVARFLLGKTRG